MSECTLVTVLSKVALTVSGLANDNFQPEMSFSTSDEEITDADMSFHDLIYSLYSRVYII